MLTINWKGIEALVPEKENNNSTIYFISIEEQNEKKLKKWLDLLAYLKLPTRPLNHAALANKITHKYVH